MVFTKQNQQSSFAAGAAILALSGAVVKLIGFCYKIPLMRLIGAEGMGYFNAAYDVYAVLCMISTSGLPIAVSVLINRYPGLHRRIFRISLVMFAMLGTLGSLGVFCAADQIAIWVRAPNAAQCLRFIAPAVLFVCLSGALKGYYQAKRNMRPTAVSQVVEASGKLLFGLLFAHMSIRYDANPAMAAAFAVLGLSLGTMLCLLYLGFCYKTGASDEMSKTDAPRLVRELFMLALPVTLGAILSGLSKVIDLALVMRRLQDGGMAQQGAVAMYGCYTSMVIPLFGVIPALFSSVSLPLVPHLGHAISNRDTISQKLILQTAFRWCIVISIPSSLGIAMLGEQILRLLFSDAAEIHIATVMLVIISTAIPASCLITVTGAVLHAYGHPSIPMVATFLGCLLKTVTLYILCAMPGVGILAAPISTVLCCIVIVSVNLWFIGRYAPVFPYSLPLILALVASVASIAVSAFICRCLESQVWQVGICIPIAVLLYFLIAYLCGLLRISDIKSIKTQE